MQSPVGRYFNRHAASFDGIFTGDKPALGRLWDRLTRRNVTARHDLMLEWGAPWHGQRVLDVGCASGRGAIAIAVGGAAEVIGIDFADRAIDLAVTLAQRAGVEASCRFIVASAEQFRDPAGFDTVVANGFFDYIPEPARLMTHLSGLTRRRLYASFPARTALRVPARSLWWRLHGVSLQVYSRRRVLTVCAAAGLTITRMARLGPIYLIEAVPDRRA